MPRFDLDHGWQSSGAAAHRLGCVISAYFFFKPFKAKQNNSGEVVSGSCSEQTGNGKIDNKKKQNPVAHVCPDPD